MEMKKSTKVANHLIAPIMIRIIIRNLIYTFGLLKRRLVGVISVTK
jgi:hypothetical protein